MSFLLALQDQVLHSTTLADGLSPGTLLSCLAISRSSITCTDTVLLRKELLRLAAVSLKAVAEILDKSSDELQQLQRQTYQAKNSDYGSSYMTTGLLGIVVRMIDKLKRWQQLQLREQSVKTESKADTLLDLSLYALLAINCMDSS